MKRAKLEKLEVLQHRSSAKKKLQAKLSDLNLFLYQAKESDLLILYYSYFSLLF